MITTVNQSWPWHLNRIHSLYRGYKIISYISARFCNFDFSTMVEWMLRLRQPRASAQSRSIISRAELKLEYIVDNTSPRRWISEDLLSLLYFETIVIVCHYGYTWNNTSCRSNNKLSCWNYTGICYLSVLWYFLCNVDKTYQAYKNSLQWKINALYCIINTIIKFYEFQSFCCACTNSIQFEINLKLFSYFFSSAVDTTTGHKVAIKKLARPFQSAVHAKRTYRELRMLKHMNHENVRTQMEKSISV